MINSIKHDNVEDNDEEGETSSESWASFPQVQSRPIILAHLRYVFPKQMVLNQKYIIIKKLEV